MLSDDRDPAGIGGDDGAVPGLYPDYVLLTGNHHGVAFFIQHVYFLSEGMDVYPACLLISGLQGDCGFLEHGQQILYVSGQDVFDHLTWSYLVIRYHFLSTDPGECENRKCQ